MTTKPSTKPLINGQSYDFSHIVLNVNGRKFLGITEINYSDKLEPTKSRGTSAQPTERTRGQYEAEGSITILRRYWPELRGMLSQGDVGYMETEFTTTCSYANGKEPVQTDTLTSCRIKNNERSNQEGGDPLKLKLDLDIMLIDDGGKSPITNPIR